MKKLLVLLFILTAITDVYSQNKRSILLKTNTNNEPFTWRKILVVGTDRVDGYQFSQSNRSKYSTKEDFSKSFLAELRTQQESENLWIDDLLQNEFEFTIIHQFWSVNIVAIDASPEAINYLSTHPEVYWMEEISERKVVLHTPIEGSFIATRAANGKEQGIVAVKADSLWKLGYTGKGSRLLTFDTGVWPKHPSIKNQFLGNHLPLNQAWFGYDTYFPADKPGSHGTHVTGTCLGLDPETSDTVGVAFNAYFMATDPIVESLSDIKTVYEIFLAYEWALNPDGDTNTVDDMPHVINNSWGRPVAPGDTVLCDGWVNDMFVNIEVAGIISIHSAGNSGPSMGTIGYPAASNASVVNNFSIGAVNGNNASFPIASFSSRGPTSCGGVGALLIKPEVVAPGVGVRSSIRDLNSGEFIYDSKQGTSMSAPHVSGVSLLLREAFPTATATEIKEAMYYSATDLGAVGEDNVYGNGMIDAVASFNYLSNLYTPSTPSLDTFDISIKDFSIKNYASYCDLDFFTVYFDNTNDIPQSSLKFEYGIWGTTPWTASYTSGTLYKQDSITLGIYADLPIGWNEFYVKTIYTDSLTETDMINNIRFVRFWVNDSTALPYKEDFDSTHVYESSMYVGNPDERITWDTLNVMGKNGMSNAAVLKFGKYSPQQYQHDYLQTPNFVLSPTTKLMLRFDLSYQTKFIAFSDSLLVRVSTDCGVSWSNPIYAKGPDSLNTTDKPYVTGTNWIPTEDKDWRTEYVDLSAYANSTTLMVRLETANGRGNFLYVDNINVYDDAGAVGIAENMEPNFVMFPNPVTNGILNFSESASGTIYSISGVELRTFSNQKMVDVSSLKKGVYLVSITETNKVYKLIIK